MGSVQFQHSGRVPGHFPPHLRELVCFPEGNTAAGYSTKWQQIFFQAVNNPMCSVSL